MKKNNKGFTLIELLAVIVVLAIVMVLATTTVLPLMADSRESAFRVEATRAVQKAEDAMTLYNMNQLELNKDATKSCRNGETKTMCFTIDELVRLQLSEVNTDDFSGRVDIDFSDAKNVKYTLYLKKNAEFSLSGETFNDYSKNGTIKNVSTWSTNYESCSCS